MALFNLDATTAFAVASSEEFTATLHAVDQLILRWQKNPDEWNQLLLEVFGRIAPLDLSGITIEILNGQTMAGLHGAYAPVAPDGDERIYINEDWLAMASVEAIHPFCWRSSAMPLITGSMAITTLQVMKGPSFRR